MAFMLPVLGAVGGAGSGVLGLVSSGVSAASVLIGGMAQHAQYQGEAALARQNAAIARDNAGRARLEAASAEEAQRRDARKHLGSMAAALAQNGADGQMLVRQSATEAELDALNIRYRGELEAQGHLSDARGLDAQAKAAKRQAGMALIGAGLGAGGRLLSGAADYGVWREKTRLAGQRPAPNVYAGARRRGVPGGR